MTQRPSHESEPVAANPHGGRAFWIGALLGWTVMAYALRGVIVHAVDTRPAELAWFVMGGVVAHDAFAVPVVLVLGAVVARLVGGRLRAPVQGALLMGGTVALFAYPLVRGYGRAQNNPSSLPRNYAVGVIVVIAAAWLCVALVVLVAGWRRWGHGSARRAERRAPGAG